VALSAERLAKWMASDLSKLDLLIIQIDGLHIGNDLVLVAALGIDGNGDKHPLGLVEGATENTAVVQALIDNLIERGLDPTVCRLFIIDGAKALSKVIRRTFGAYTPIQRCQLHKARNVIERLPKPLHASVRRALRQAWELDDADKAERLLRNLARRLDQDAPGVAASILEGLDEMLTVNRLKLPAKLRRSLACTNSIENMMGTVRRVCRNVKRWRNAAMALRWTAAGMMEAARGFRRLKPTGCSQSSELPLSLTRPNTSPPRRLNRKPMPHSISHSDACPRLFNKKWGIPSASSALMAITFWLHTTRHTCVLLSPANSHSHLGSQPLTASPFRGSRRDAPGLPVTSAWTLWLRDRAGFSVPRLSRAAQKRRHSLSARWRHTSPSGCARCAGIFRRP
jgi:transposase-like protein